MPKYEDLCDVLSESGIVATVINHPDMLNFSDDLTIGCFSDESNGVLYGAVKYLYSSGIEKIDSFNIMTAINNEPALKARSAKLTPDFVSEIVQNSQYIARGTPSEYIKLVNIVAGFSYRRKLYRELSRAQNDCLCTDDIMTLQKKVDEKIDGVGEKYIIGEEIPSIGEVADTLWKNIEEMQGGGLKAGIPTSFPTLNKNLIYQKSQLVLYMGYLKSGKSILLAQEAISAAMNGVPTTIINTEMDDTLWFLRAICHISGVPMSLIKTGLYSAEEKERVKKAIGVLKKIPLSHMYMPGFTNDLIYSTVKRMHQKGKCDFFVLDYIKDRDSKDSSGVFYGLGILTNVLKNDIAGGLDIPVLSACQTNRGGGVGESLKIAQFASALVKIEKKPYEDYAMNEKQGNYKFTILSNRLGEQHDPDSEWIDVNFCGSYCRFEEAQEQHSAIELL